MTLHFVRSQVAAAAVKASRGKGKQKLVDGVEDEANLSSKAAPAASAGFASENGGSMHLVRVGHSKYLDLCFVV